VIYELSWYKSAYYLSGSKTSVKQYLSLVSKPAPLPAVRASPGNGITGHAPQILHHAPLAYLKTAATGPAEREFSVTYMAAISLLFAPFPASAPVLLFRFHKAFTAVS